MAEANNEVSAADASHEEKLNAEKEIAKGMKISELKLSLQAKGILTTSFVEKSEFVNAYAEAMVSAPTMELGNELGDDFSGEEDEIPPAIMHRIERLKQLNGDRDEQRKQYLKERAELEAKYHALAQPLYDERKQVVIGERDEEIAEREAAGTEKGDPDDFGIPQFWLTAIGRMGPVGALLSEPDLECLEHLQDIQCTEHDNGEGFTLSFHFAPNEYFENSILTKSYVVPNLLLADEPILKDVQGCEINWKDGKCLTSKEVIQQQRGKGKNAGQIRAVKKQKKQESFFHFFTPPKIPDISTTTEQEAEQLEHAFDEDYDIAQAFRSHIIPKAVLWFTGEVIISR